MKIKEEDLHLNRFKIGAELTTVKVKGSKLECSGKIVLHSWDTRNRGWRAENGLLVPVDGRGYYAMHSRKGEPHFYYSANPDHIVTRVIQSNKARIEREDREKEQTKKLADFKAELKALLEKYGAEIIPVQLSGDDQGVELGIEYTL